MLERLPIKNIAEESVDCDYKVIVFDGMAVVNKIDIKKMKLKSCFFYKKWKKKHKHLTKFA